MDIEENISKINEHIERVKEYLEYGMPYSEYLDLQISFETILNELEKEDKIIDLMAEELADWYMDNQMSYKEIDKKYVINKFTNKVEEDRKE